MTAQPTPPATETEIVQTPEQRVALVLKENNLDPDSAQGLQAAIVPMFAEVEKWRAQVALLNITDASQVREMKLARDTRLALKEIRVNGDKKRKAMKEASLRYGRAVDGAFNLLAFLIAPLEETLLEKEKFAERQERARIDKLRVEREELLKPYGLDTSLYQLGLMPAETFADLLAGQKAVAEQKQKAIHEAELARIAAENARLAEEKRVRDENARLLKEKADREEADRQKAEADRLAKEKADAEAAALIRAREFRKKTREEALAHFQFDSTFTPLGDMPEEEFAALLAKAENDFKTLANQREEAERARLAHEQALAEERRKSEERLAAQRAETERVAKEAADREAAAQAARDLIAALTESRFQEIKQFTFAERPAQVFGAMTQDAWDAAMVTARATHQAEVDRRAKAEQILADERELKRRYEQHLMETARELQAAKDAEAKRQADLAAEQKRAAAAPDKEKMEAFRVAIVSVVLPPMTTPEAEIIATSIVMQQRKFNDWLIEKIATL